MTRSVTFRYFELCLLLFLPLLSLGYIQTFDMPWGPRIPQVGSGNNVWLLYHVLQLVAVVVGSMVVQKVLIIGIFLLAGVGAHRLVEERVGSGAAYMAGVLYMVNPFVYTRLMAGQWLVLLGYALLPWAVVSLWRLMREPGWRSALGTFGWTAAIGLSSIHTVGFVLAAAVVLCIAAGKQGIGARVRWGAAVAAGWLVVNALWLVPLLLGKSGNAVLISGFGPSQLHAFASSGSVLHNVGLSTLLLQGFWADGQGRYSLPSHLGVWWGVVVLLLGCLIITGLVVALRRRDKLGLALAILALVAWWLGMGVGGSLSAGTSEFLVRHIPLYRGYREPQKWLMLLALGYTYFAAIGVDRFIVFVREHKPVLQPSALYGPLLLPILITPMLLWGAGGQLVSAQYPTGWHTVADTLDGDTSDYKVLVLPWHLYLPVSFTHRVVASPADRYFKQPMIVSDDPELAGVPPAQSSPLYRQIDNVLLPQRNVRRDAGTQLAPYGVKYVILLHEADWRSYGWLGKQADLHPVQRTDSISLYKVGR